MYISILAYIIHREYWLNILKIYFIQFEVQNTVSEPRILGRILLQLFFPQLVFISLFTECINVSTGVSLSLAWVRPENLTYKCKQRNKNQLVRTDETQSGLVYEFTNFIWNSLNYWIQLSVPLCILDRRTF